MSAPDYYQILELADSATTEEISERIKEKKRTWIQRQNNAPKPEQRREAEEYLALVPHIEAALTNHYNRIAYDQELERAKNGSQPVGPPVAPSMESGREMPRERLIQIHQLIDEGNVAEALNEATVACREFPDDPAAWRTKGNCENAWDQPEQAAQSFLQAVALKPNDALSYYFLGQTYAEIGEVAEAERQFLRAKQIDPDDIDYDIALAKIAYQKDNFDEAIATLEQCHRREPENEEVRFWLARLYRDKGMEDWHTIEEGGIVATTKAQVETAEKYLARANRIAPADPEIATHLAETRASIEESKRRTFHGNPLAPAVWIFFGLFHFAMPVMGAASEAGVHVLLAFFHLGVAGFYIFSCMTPVYLRNKRTIKDGGATSLDAVATSGEGCGGMIFMGIFICVLMPVFAIVNFFKNWVFA